MSTADEEVGWKQDLGSEWAPSSLKSGSLLVLSEPKATDPCVAAVSLPDAAESQDSHPCDEADPTLASLLSPLCSEAGGHFRST